MVCVCCCSYYFYLNCNSKSISMFQLNLMGPTNKDHIFHIQIAYKKAKMSKSYAFIKRQKEAEKKGFVLVVLFIAETHTNKYTKLFVFDTNYIPLQYTFMPGLKFICVTLCMLQWVNICNIQGSRRTNFIKQYQKWWWLKWINSHIWKITLRNDLNK